MLRIRPAAPADRDFIDRSYAAVSFVPCAPGDDVLVAELDGARVGLGRLVPVGDGAVELGGIWTDERHRGRGVAAAMVGALLERLEGRRTYCIPFAALAGFYRGFGFAEASPDEAVPAAVADKLRHCRAAYDQPVALLVRS